MNQWKICIFSIFQWWPYENEESVERIFPNEFDTENFFLAGYKYFIPTKKAQPTYYFRNHFPTGILFPDVQEFLIFIGTKKTN